MSRYNAQPTSYPSWGFIPFPAIPCDVFDGNGVNLGAVIACDTETGEVLQHVRGEDGMIVIDYDYAATKVFRAKPPLTVTPRKQ